MLDVICVVEIYQKGCATTVSRSLMDWIGLDRIRWIRGYSMVDDSRCFVLARLLSLWVCYTFVKSSSEASSSSSNDGGREGGRSRYCMPVLCFMVWDSFYCRFPPAAQFLSHQLSDGGFWILRALFC